MERIYNYKEENMNIQFIPTYNSPEEGYTAISIAFERHPQMQKALGFYSKNHTPQGA